MSRLDTQDRLNQGPRPLDIPRSFLVNPERISAGRTQDLSGLLRQLGGTVSSVLQVRASNRDKIQADRDRTIYNDVLAAKNHAEDDPTKIGEYADLLDSAIAVSPEASTLRTNLLNLSSAKDIQRVIDARNKQDDAAYKGKLKGLLDRFSDGMDLQDQELIESSFLERQDILAADILETLPEELVTLINNDESVRNHYAANIRSIASQYEAEHRSRLDKVRNRDLQDAREAYALDARVGSLDLASTADQLSAANGGRTTPYEEQVALASTISDQLLIDLQSGSITISAAVSSLEKVRSQVATLDNQDAQRLLNNTAASVTSEYAQTSARSLERKYEQLITGIPPLTPDQLLEALDDHAIGLWEAATGIEVGVDKNIASFDPGTGFNADLADAIAGVYSDIDRRVRSVKKNRDVGAITSRSIFDDVSSEVALENADVPGAYIAIARFGGNAGVPEEQVWLEAGAAQTRFDMANFANVEGRGERLATWFTEHGEGGVELASGGLLALGDAEFNAYTLGMDAADTLSLQYVRDYLIENGADMKSIVGLPDEQRAEFYNTLRAQYDKGRQDSETYENTPHGSSPASDAEAKKFSAAILKGQGLAEDLPLDTATQNAILIETTKLASAGLKPGEEVDTDVMAKAAAASMKAKGLVLHYDEHTNKYTTASKNTVPEGAGMSRADVEKALNLPNIKLSVKLSEAYNATNRVARPFLFASPLTAAQGAALKDVSLDGVQRRKDGGALALLLGETIDGAVENTNSVPEALAPLIADKLVLSGVTGSEAVSLFEASTEDESFLRLRFVLSNGRGRIMAKGRIGGRAYVGEDMLDIAPFDPSLFPYIKMSKEEYLDALRETRVQSSPPIPEEQRRLIAESLKQGTSL